MPETRPMNKVQRLVIVYSVSVTIGIVWFFILPSSISSIVGDNSRLYIPMLVAPYAVSGFILGLIWPQFGWRLGMALFAVWPFVILFAIFLGADKQVLDWKGETLDFGELLLILPASCLGAWLGSRIRKSDHPNEIHKSLSRL